MTTTKTINIIATTANGIQEVDALYSIDGETEVMSFHDFFNALDSVEDGEEIRTVVTVGSPEWDDLTADYTVTRLS